MSRGKLEFSSSPERRSCFRETSGRRRFRGRGRKTTTAFEESVERERGAAGDRNLREIRRREEWR